MRTPAGTITPALVSDPALLSEADPLAPIMTVNTATLAGKLSFKQPRPRLAAVLRACELRALVELVKMQQAALDDLILIAVDCAGTLNGPLYIKKGLGEREKGLEMWRELNACAADRPEAPYPELRSACKICEQPVFPHAQIQIELFGGNLENGLRISLPLELAEKLDLVEDDQGSGEREQIIDHLVAARTALRETEFAVLHARLQGEEGLQKVFAACIRCHNCMTVCPICYCKTCVFKSPLFDHEPMQFVSWTRQKGAFRLPSDTLLFHLTRLNHMALSCVGCGMCTEACPAELPVGMVFRTIGQRLQNAFDYAPGHSLEDPLPLVNFKADEWTEVGE
jgi:formate dehydrogenase subunit beta